MPPEQYGSKWEENVYIILQKMKVEFEYQVPELGGWVPGGTIIDFVVHMPGALRPIALFVDGPRWHQGEKEPYDLVKRARLEIECGYEVKVIGEESEDMEQADKWMRENL